MNIQSIFTPEPSHACLVLALLNKRFIAELQLCGALGGRGLSNADDGSSMSDVSGISNLSNKTTVYEESSLVLEVYERGRLHHYLIPHQAAQQGRFQKRGTKLHVYLDHVFTAQHIKL